MSKSVHAFILLVFATIGLSFLATTGVLIWEFRRHEWLMIANFYSHLFIFFPTLGIVTLIAFYLPSCVFLDLYLHHVKHGRLRFIVGFFVTAVLSVVAGLGLVSSTERSVFEVAPAVLSEDAGEPSRCLEGGSCERLPVLTAIDNVRRVSQSRIGLSDLERNCRPDALKDQPPGSRRYCFVSTALPADISQLTGDQRTSDAECCRAQARFTKAVKTLHDSAGGASLTGRVHAALLPFKIFFAIILITISLMLAVHRKALTLHYEHYMDAIERGVLVGAAAMVIFPIMAHAFLQSAGLVYFGAGPSGGFRATAPLISLGFGAWGLLLLFFFYGRRNQEIQQLARMGGIVGSAIAFLKYDRIIDVCVRLFGSGADWSSLVIVCGGVVAALVALLWRITYEIETAEADVPGGPGVADASGMAAD